jgi:NAD+ kinase
MIAFVRHPHVDPGLPGLLAARQFLDRSAVPYCETTREDPSRLREDTRLLVTLGGDGTLLHAARVAAERDLPVLGVNLGRLGFLTEVDVDDLCDGLRRFLEGDYRIEERTLVEVTVLREGRPVHRAVGLNEVAIQRQADAGLVRLRMLVDGQDIGEIDADGVIVATATGSTAYALAAGGPILEPTIEDLLLVPMSPFALTVRPIVLPPHQGATVELPRSAALATVDGGTVWRLRAGDRVRAAGYERRLRMVRLTPPERFWELLREKLGWGLPLVPTPSRRGASGPAAEPSG